MLIVLISKNKPINIINTINKVINILCELLT